MLQKHNKMRCCHLLTLLVILLLIPAIANARDAHDTSDPCWIHTESRHFASDKSVNAQLDDEISRFQLLVEQALTYRAETIKTANNLKHKIENQQPLSGADLDYMNQGMLAHLTLRKQLFDVAFAHECWISASPKELAHWHIDKRAQLKGVMVSLAAALTLYDNYLLAISIYEQDTKLRRLLDESDTGYHIKPDQLLKVTESYNSITNRARVRTAMRWYEARVNKYKFTNTDDSFAYYLQILINQSPSYDMTRQYSPLYVLSKHIELFTNVTTDVLSDLAQEGTNLFSAVFGNTIGLVATRKGKLYEKPQVKMRLVRQLRAGDILLEKTPFRLTDTLIPGHWGHAAIWVGTEAELRHLGIWDHPVLRPYQESIRRGERVVEALRSGVQLSSLGHFLNVDDVAVLRDETLTDEERVAHIILALRQVGKAYDFNFDVETTDRIVCSELVYLVFTDITWPTGKTLGRYTISPDNVAQKALNGGPLKLISFYHDGQAIEKQPLMRLATLLNDKE
ncbi:MAG: YiiX/YebB-like N1pC/P60 family cysteine hydrolase [Gammaproteobacteria bacterium]|jgi:hypothetical protein